MKETLYKKGREEEGGKIIHPFCVFSYKRQLSLTLPLPFTPSHPQSRGRIPTYGRIPHRTSPTQPLPTRVFEEWAARNKWAHSYGAEWLHCFAAWPNVNKPEVAACRPQQEAARLDLPPNLGWMISSRKLFALGIHLDIILFIYSKMCTEQPKIWASGNHKRRGTINRGGFLYKFKGIHSLVKILTHLDLILLKKLPFFLKQLLQPSHQQTGGKNYEVKLSWMTMIHGGKH